MTRREPPRYSEEARSRRILAAEQRSLAAEAGFDVWRCEFCGRRIYRRIADYIVGLDGMRAHRRCVERFA